MSSAIFLLAAINPRPQGAERPGGEEPENGLFGAALGAELSRGEPQRTAPDSEEGAETAAYGERRAPRADEREAAAQEAPPERSGRDIPDDATRSIDPVAFRVALQPGQIAPEAPRVGIRPVRTLRQEAGPTEQIRSPRMARGLAETAAAATPNTDPRTPGIEQPVDSTIEPAASLRPRGEQSPPRVAAPQSPSAGPQARPERAELPLGPPFRRPEEGAEPRPSAARPAAPSPQAERASADRPLLEVSPRRGDAPESEPQRTLPDALQGRQLLDSEPQRSQARASVADIRSVERGSDGVPVRPLAPPPAPIADIRSVERGSDGVAERSNAPPPLPADPRQGAEAPRFVTDTQGSGPQPAGLRAFADVGVLPIVDASVSPVGNSPLAATGATHVSFPVAATPASTAPESIPLHAEWLAARGGGSARLRLHPPELGELELQVRVRGKTVEIVIAAHEEVARQIVQEYRDQLSQNLASRDLRMEQFEVRELPGRDAASGREGTRDSAGEWQEPGDARRTLRGRRATTGEADGLSAAGVGLAAQAPRSSSAEAVDLRV